MSVFSDRLRLIMDERGITQIKLSEITGIPKSAISQYLADRFRPNRDRTYVICRALDTDPAWLVGLSNDKRPFSSLKPAPHLDENEIKLVQYYRENPEMREALMLFIENNGGISTVFRAAKSKDGRVAPGIETLSAERLKRLSEAPETDVEL